jgi:hypothetical protein
MVDPLHEDTLKRLEKNMTTGAENLAIDRALAAEPHPEGVLAPITLMPQPSTLAPIAYVIHRWAKQCLTCGAEHHYSDVFALNHLKSHWGKFVRNMVPVQRPEWNVPLQVYELAPKAVPFCHECVDLARDHLAMLPRPPEPQITTPGSGNITPTSTAPKAPKPESKTKKKVWDTDDLLAALD